MGQGSDFPPHCRNPPPENRAFVALQASSLTSWRSPCLVGCVCSSSPELAPPLIKAWVKKNPSKKLEQIILRRHMRPDVGAFEVPRFVFPLHHMLVKCLEDYFRGNLLVALSPLFALLFCNFVICASPFPPVFGLFFALPPCFAAAAGLPLRWFARQMKKTPHRDHPKAPRRRMCRNRVRNLQTSDFNVFQSYLVWQHLIWVYSLNLSNRLRRLLSVATNKVSFLSHHLLVSCVDDNLTMTL